MNGFLDEKVDYTLGKYGTADLYVDDKLVEQGVADFNYYAPLGSKYKVVLHANPGYVIRYKDVLDLESGPMMYLADCGVDTLEGTVDRTGTIAFYPYVYTERRVVINAVLPDGVSGNIYQNGMFNVTGNSLIMSSFYKGRQITNLSDYTTTAGYSFGGFWSEKTGGKQYKEGDEFDTLDDLILYTRWIPNTFTLNFDYNIPENKYSTLSNADVKSKTIKYTSEGSNVYGELPVPQYTGYSFDGWYTAPTGGEKVDASTTYMDVNTATVYAHWTVNTFYLDLNSVLDDNGGMALLPESCYCDLYVNGQLTQSHVQDVWIKLPYGSEYEFKNFSTREGLEFTGEVQGNAGLKGVVTQELWVYPVYKTKTITTTFHRNTSASDDVTDVQQFTYSVADQQFSDKGWTYEGHTLLGWAHSTNGEVKYPNLCDVGGGWIDEFYPNIDLYAIWQTNTYNNQISHWLGGFKNQEGNNGTAKTMYRIRQTSFSSLYNASFEMGSDRAADIPNGCYLNTTFGTASVDDTWKRYSMGTSLTQRAQDMGFEYYYFPYDYTITYNLDGGTNNSSNPSTYNVLYGVSFKAPYKDGFDFEGWYTADGNKITGINEGCNATFSSADDLYTKLAARTTGNITVTAKWKARSNDIKYVVETEYPSWAGDQLHAGGTVSASDETVSESNTPVGSTATITNKFNFDGWYSSSGELITKETTIKPLNANADKKGSFTKSYLGGQGTYDADTDTYSVLVDLSKISSTYWSGLGCGVYHDCPTLIPWNNWYIAEFEVWSPVDATLVVDINNHPYDGSSNWNGNDNDNVSTRSSMSKSLKANTWTKMTIWYQNSSSLNTGHKALMDTHSIDIHYDNSLGNQSFKIRGYKAAVYSTLIKELDTFTAKFSPWQHTVVYDANGGVGAPASFRKCTWLGRWISTTIPTRTGYTFTSWNTQRDGSGTSYQPGDNYPPDQNGGTVTLYAQWSYDPVTVKVPQILIGDASGSSSFRVKCDDIAVGNIKVDTPNSFSYKQSGKTDIEAIITQKSSSNIITPSNKCIVYNITTKTGLSAGCWNGNFNIGLTLAKE